MSENGATVTRNQIIVPDENLRILSIKLLESRLKSFKNAKSITICFNAKRAELRVDEQVFPVQLYDAPNQLTDCFKETEVNGEKIWEEVGRVQSKLMMSSTQDQQHLHYARETVRKKQTEEEQRRKEHTISHVTNDGPSILKKGARNRLGVLAKTSKPIPTKPLQTAAPSSSVASSRLLPLRTTIPPAKHSLAKTPSPSPSPSPTPSPSPSPSHVPQGGPGNTTSVFGNNQQKETIQIPTPALSSLSTKHTQNGVPLGGIPISGSTTNSTSPPTVPSSNSSGAQTAGVTTPSSPPINRVTPKSDEDLRQTIINILVKEQLPCDAIAARIIWNPDSVAKTVRDVGSGTLVNGSFIWSLKEKFYHLVDLALCPDLSPELQDKIRLKKQQEEEKKLRKPTPSISNLSGSSNPASGSSSINGSVGSRIASNGSKTHSSATAVNHRFPPLSSSSLVNKDKAPHRVHQRYPKYSLKQYEPIPQIIRNDQEYQQNCKKFKQIYHDYEKIYSEITENIEIFLQFEKRWKACCAPSSSTSSSIHEDRKELRKTIENEYSRRRDKTKQLKDLYERLHNLIGTFKNVLVRYAKEKSNNQTNGNLHTSDQPVPMALD